MENPPILGVIGGSGFYEMPGLTGLETYNLETPFGSPSSPIVVGTLEGQRVAFLARHGPGHSLAPGEVNYRANIYALKALGVPRLLSISACGSLREDYAPGHLVIPDQLFDFTKGRARSFFGEGLVAHVGVANPFCADLSGQLYQAAIAAGAAAHQGGTFITVEGPRFSTRGESNTYRAWGMSLIGMTTSPEAFLAREAEMCYAVMAHVTDYDVWHISEEAVSVKLVVRTLQKNTELRQDAIRRLVGALGERAQGACDQGCAEALASALITNPPAIPPETRARLSLLVDKYLP